MKIIDIRHGSTRTVILIARYAIKIPSFVEWRLFLYGLLGNMQESLWSKCGIDRLCKVLFSIPGGFIVVMERAEPLTREEFDKFDYDGFIKDCDLCLTFIENKYDSFGKIGGKIVAVDYGS